MNMISMKVLIIDLTHGGILLSEEFSKLGFQVYAYDIYNTLTNKDKTRLKENNINLINDLNEFKPSSSEDLIISPIHCPVNLNNELKLKNKCEYLNFHQANSLILKEWNEKRKKDNKIFIEITGVKGKTSTAYLIKNILSQDNEILFLSSLGSYYINNNEETLLKKDISINPTSLIDLIYESENKHLEYDYILTECSLGVSPLNDISVLTNINDNYPIANKTKTASFAKKQVFNSNIIISKHETLEKYYPEEYDEFKNKINSFSMNSRKSTLYVENIEYDMNNTKIKIKYSNLKTLNKKRISGSFKINTFAPGEYNVLNILAAITTCLTLNIDENTIIKSINNNYESIPGRTNKKIIKNSVILEEINPGINVNSIKKSIEMVENLENYEIVIGGKYGVTCEEIDEKELIKYLNKKSNNIPIIVTDELGENIHTKTKTNIKYYEDYNQALKMLIKNNKNILFIYRSNYLDLKKR